MLGRRFARIVEECLHRLDRGEDLPDVLADFPAESDQLKPLLLIAMASRSMAIPTPSQAAHRLGRNQMLFEMDQDLSSPDSSRSNLLSRTRKMAARMQNSLRARRLVQPVPSYRLALIALVVFFGSGLYALSASASPGNFISAIASDIQNVMGFFTQDSPTNPQDNFRFVRLHGGDNPLFVVNRGSKAAFLLDFLDNDNPETNRFAFGMSFDPPPSSPENSPPPVLPETSDPVTGPSDLPTPNPHPASTVVNEVVSDTAKEKNPVWDQLPFNQTEDSTSDEGNVPVDAIQDEDDKDKDENDKDKEEPTTGPPSWIYERREDDDDDDDD
jgi:hypothetical protein